MMPQKGQRQVAELRGDPLDRTGGPGFELGLKTSEKILEVGIEWKGDKKTHELNQELTRRSWRIC